MERTNHTLKEYLKKQNKTVGDDGPTPGSKQNQLAIVLFTLNTLNIFLNFTATERHFKTETPLPRPSVKYRQSPDPNWYGPIPLIIWGRGHAAVLTPTGPLWVPAKNVRPWHDDVASKPQEPNTQLQSEPNRDLSSVLSHKDGTKGYLGAGETTGAAGSANAGE